MHEVVQDLGHLMDRSFGSFVVFDALLCCSLSLGRVCLANYLGGGSNAFGKDDLVIKCSRTGIIVQMVTSFKWEKTKIGTWRQSWLSKIMACYGTTQK